MELKNKKISSFILKHVIRYPEGHSILTCPKKINLKERWKDKSKRQNNYSLKLKHIIWKVFRKLKTDIRLIFKLTVQRYTCQVEIWIFETEEFCYQP